MSAVGAAGRARGGESWATGAVLGQSRCLELSRGWVFVFVFVFFFLCSWEVSAVALVLCTLAAEAWKRVRHERLREVIYMCVYIYSAICDSL